MTAGRGRPGSADGLGPIRDSPGQAAQARWTRAESQPRCWPSQASPELGWTPAPPPPADPRRTASEPSAARGARGSAGTAGGGGQRGRGGGPQQAGGRGGAAGARRHTEGGALLSVVGRGWSLADTPRRLAGERERVTVAVLVGPGGVRAGEAGAAAAPRGLVVEGGPARRSACDAARLRESV
jgi:hypothetical protein